MRYAINKEQSNRKANLHHEEGLQNCNIAFFNEPKLEFGSRALQCSW